MPEITSYPYLHRTPALASGYPFPLGASLDATGCNFAVYSPAATQVVVCLFDANEQLTASVSLTERSGPVWHGRIQGLRAGQAYALRADGPWDPAAGHYFDPRKLLLDPYAQALTRPVRYAPSQRTLAGATDTPGAHPAPSCTDSSADTPKCLVVDHNRFDWQDEPARRPQTAWSRTIIYETHIRGLTMTHPHVPEPERGTYLGMAHPAVIAHLVSLGVTAVQLMPLQAQMPEPFLGESGLTNYWGYNSIAWFAPDPRYACRDAVTELKTLVRSLHQAGLEVILDVVYNHSAEADAQGCTLSLKGLAAADSYSLGASGLDFVNHTGCGNTLNLESDFALALVMDSLWHWVTQYHIDGFRFDLATSLGRDQGGFNTRATFFRTLAQDPLLSGIKRIAEPWDIGPDGYQLGSFPPAWYECNDRFRDTLRGFWRGDAGLLPDFCTRLMGSRDVLQKGEGTPSASLNYVTYHDGFTLDDLVTYEHKHNQANGEENRDGHGHNLSANYGVEGPTQNPDILALRQRQKRNLLMSLLLAQGPAHLLGGDELSRSQEGNNNAYCQDSPVSWYHWSHQDPALARFIARLIRLRQSSPLFHALTFSARELAKEPAHSDSVHWFNTRGEPMQIADWHDPENRSISLVLASTRGDPGLAASAWPKKAPTQLFLWLIHAGNKAQTFHLPGTQSWQLLLDTRYSDGIPANTQALDTAELTLGGRSQCLLGAF